MNPAEWHKSEPWLATALKASRFKLSLKFVPNTMAYPNVTCSTNNRPVIRTLIPLRCTVRLYPPNLCEHLVLTSSDPKERKSI